MSESNDISCPLCTQGQGCSRLFGIFGIKRTQLQVPGEKPRSALLWAYGLPLFLALSGTLIGAYLNELFSMLGFVIGLLISFFVLRIKFGKHLS